MYGTFDTFKDQYCINDTEQNKKQDKVFKAPSVLQNKERELKETLSQT